MTEHDRLAGRNEIDIISQGFRWTDSISCQPKDPASQPTPIGVIGDQETDSCQNSNQQRGHEMSLRPNMEVDSNGT